MKKHLIILLAAAITFTSCSNSGNNTSATQQPYTDLKNECYKGKVKQLTKTEYEGAYFANGKWNKPADAVATVRVYTYDTLGFNTATKEYYLYRDTLYATNTQKVTFDNGLPAVKETYTPEGHLDKRSVQTPTADTGFSIDVYDSANNVTQRQIMTLNKDGKQKTSDFTYFDEYGQTSHTLSFSFVYGTDQLLDSLKLKMYDGTGKYLPAKDILLVPNYLQKDKLGNPTLSIVQGYGAAAGTNMLVEYEYEYYE